MIQLFPNEKIDCVGPKNFTLNNCSNDSLIWCLLEVDLGCPDEWYVLHDDYPVAGEKIKVRKEMFSNYQLQITEYNKFALWKNKKFISSQGKKRKYKLYYQNFKLCQSLGLQLIKIHRILEFKQEIFFKIICQTQYRSNGDRK